MAQVGPLILVIDDDEFARRLLIRSLVKEGYRVEEAGDGEAGLLRYEQLHPDIVLCDAMMPVMNGYQTCIGLRSLPGGENILIVMITSLEDEQSVRRAFEAGADDYIHKPVQLPMLRQRLRLLLRAKQAEDTLRLSEERARQLAAQLETQTGHSDPLTGLPSRARLREELGRVLVAAQIDNQRTDQAIALMQLNLDHFKRVNSAFGYDLGDSFLKEVAGRLRATLRPGDFLARIGSDEFGIVLAQIDDPNTALQLADRLLKNVNESIHIDGRGFNIGASIGISFYPDDGADVDTLLRKAERALGQAKAAGRGSFRTSTNSDESILRFSLENALYRAQERGEMQLHYQPIAANSGHIEGIEALLRWKHPLHGLMLPERFLPIIEENGLIIPIGKWTLTEACRQQQRWKAEGRHFFMVINISTVQFQQPDLIDTIAQVLEVTGLSAANLELDLTEEAVMTEERETLAKLRRLSELGIKLAIDNFGMGYDSLRLLEQMPLSTLKIAPLFLRLMAGRDDSKSAAILRSICALAHQLQMHVLGKEVETEAQYQFVRSIGCDFIQGNFIGPARPVGEMSFSELETKTAYDVG